MASLKVRSRRGLPLGAAAYLTDHIDDLYAEAKRGRWSVLIECRYDPDTREIQSTERLTQLYIA